MAVIYVEEDPSIKALRESIVSVGNTIAQARHQQRAMVQKATDRAHATYLARLGHSVTIGEGKRNREIQEKQMEADSLWRQGREDESQKRLEMAFRQEDREKEIHERNKVVIDTETKLLKYKHKQAEDESDSATGYYYFYQGMNDEENFEKGDNGQYKYTGIDANNVGQKPGKEPTKKEGPEYQRWLQRKLNHSHLLEIKKNAEWSKKFAEDLPLWKQQQRETIAKLNYIESLASGVATNEGASKVKEYLESIRWRDKMTITEKINYVNGGGYETLADMFENLIMLDVKKAIAGSDTWNEAMFERVTAFQSFINHSQHPDRGNPVKDIPFNPRNPKILNVVKRWQELAAVASNSGKYQRQYDTLLGDVENLSASSILETKRLAELESQLADVVMSDALIVFNELGILPQVGQMGAMKAKAVHQIQSAIGNLSSVIQRKTQINPKNEKELTLQRLLEGGDVIEQINEGNNKNAQERDRLVFLASRLLQGNVKIEDGLYKGRLPSTAMLGEVIKKYVSQIQNLRLPVRTTGTAGTLQLIEKSPIHNNFQWSTIDHIAYDIRGGERAKITPDMFQKRLDLSTQFTHMLPSQWRPDNVLVNIARDNTTEKLEEEDSTIDHIPTAKQDSHLVPIYNDNGGNTGNRNYPFWARTVVEGDGLQRRHGMASNRLDNQHSYVFTDTEAANVGAALQQKLHGNSRVPNTDSKLWQDLISRKSGITPDDMLKLSEQEGDVSESFVEQFKEAATKFIGIESPSDSKQVMYEVTGLGTLSKNLRGFGDVVFDATNGDTGSILALKELVDLDTVLGNVDDMESRKEKKKILLGRSTKKLLAAHIVNALFFSADEEVNPTAHYLRKHRSRSGGQRVYKNSIDDYMAEIDRKKDLIKRNSSHPAGPFVKHLERHRKLCVAVYGSKRGNSVFLKILNDIVSG